MSAPDAFDAWCRDNGEHVSDDDGALVEAAPTCQHCGERVRWSARPTDARWAGFVHASGAVACAPAGTPRRRP